MELKIPKKLRMTLKARGFEVKCIGPKHYFTQAMYAQRAIDQPFSARYQEYKNKVEQPAQINSSYMLVLSLGNMLGTTVGFIEFEMDRETNSIELAYIFVYEQFRRQGASSVLVNVLFHLAVLNQVMFIHLVNLSYFSKIYDKKGFFGVDDDCFDPDEGVLGDDGFDVDEDSESKVLLLAEGLSKGLIKKMSVMFEDRDLYDIEYRLPLA